MSIVLAALLWWVPHYEIVAPTDKVVALDATPTTVVRVKNHGLFGGTFSGHFAVEGVQEADIELQLDRGESQPVELLLPTGTKTGPHLISLGGTEMTVVALRPAEYRVKLQVTPAVAKIRGKIDVVATVENVGDLAGTFPGKLTANGGKVAEKPTDIGPGESSTLLYAVRRGSTGKCRLRLGNASKTVMVVRPVRLANGYLLRRTIRGGSAHLEIRNKMSVDGMVLLTKASAQRTAVLAVYVRAHQSTTVYGIPDGSYFVWDCSGRDWNRYTRDFLTSLGRYRWKKPIVFATTSSTRYWTEGWTDYWQTSTHWTDWWIRLGSGSGKVSKAVSASAFPRL